MLLEAPRASIPLVTPDPVQPMPGTMKNFWGRYAGSRTALTYEADCEGLITNSPRGSNGFGYDPLFFYPPMGKTFAEMSEDEKLSVSHRGRALSELGTEFGKVLKWLDLRQEEEDIRRGTKDMCVNDE
jgi:XTP/dITP diphosphohydrolase